MPLPHHTRRRLGLALAMAATATVLGTSSVGADPASPASPAGPASPAAAPTAAVPLGSPRIVGNVLGPADSAFWNPAIPGTRVLTPIEPDRQVSCLTGFVPVLNCWTINKFELAPEHRPLVHVDVPVIGGPPLRIWVDVPRWGDGSTGESPLDELTRDVVVWWLTGPAAS